MSLGDRLERRAVEAPAVRRAELERLEVLALAFCVRAVILTWRVSSASILDFALSLDRFVRHFFREAQSTWLCIRVVR